jgi:hypothetical protein
MSQLRLSWAAAFAALAFALLGCGGSDETYYIPADNEIRPFTAPEAASADEAGDAATPDEDWGSSSDEGEADSAAPAAEAASPMDSKSDDASGKGAVKPGKAGKSEKPAAAAKGGGAGSP